MPVYFIPIGVYFVPEIFLPISPERVPDVSDYYLISNYGRVWHKYKARFLSITIDTKGYAFIPLSTSHGMKIMRIHRLVALHFLYQPGCEELLVNHKDGVKTNNYVNNLEWVTYSGNMRHAIETGLANSSFSYDDETIKRICEMLQAGDKTFQQISTELGVSYTLVQAINQRRVHTDISDKYVFPLRKINTTFSEDQVRAICKFISENPKPLTWTLRDYYRFILKGSLQIGDATRLQIRTVEKIYNKTTYSYISKDYNM